LNLLFTSSRPFSLLHKRSTRQFRHTPTLAHTHICPVCLTDTPFSSRPPLACLESSASIFPTLFGLFFGLWKARPLAVGIVVDVDQLVELSGPVLGGLDVVWCYGKGFP
jgi:hypothetical protein